MTFRSALDSDEDGLHKVPVHCRTLAMQVTEEDGGKLNAFAREPRMQVMADGEGSGTNRLWMMGGLILVLALVAVAAGIS